MTSREIRLAARPQGEPVPADFDLAEVEVPDPGPGEVLVRNSYISVDPYMRGRMRDVRSYVPPFQIGEVMDGGAVGQVVASNDGKFDEGAWVVSLNGWREWFVSDGSGMHAVDPTTAPVTAFLGALGMPGLTAYAGLFRIGEFRAGDRVYVSAAAGAVGSQVGQMARLRGAERVVGSAGSAEKVRHLTDDLGFDAAFSYRDGDLDAALRAHMPKGIDLYFDNVGGDHLGAALARMRTFGRVALCGAISQYNEEAPPAGPANFIATLTNRLTIRGFIVTDHGDLLHEFLREASAWVRSGELVYRETIVDGIENAPGAFIDLLRGANVGKMLVRVGPDP